NSYFQKGEVVTGQGPVFGYPKPVVKWTKDGAPLATTQLLWSDLLLYANFPKILVLML
ncbi:hypothetical protein CAEBREN_01046, partial [Caenorhabditis brenneri]